MLRDRQNTNHYQKKMNKEIQITERAQLIHLEELKEIPEYSNYRLCPVSINKIYKYVFEFVTDSIEELLNGCHIKRNEKEQIAQSMNMELRTSHVRLSDVFNIDNIDDDINHEDQTESPDSFVRVEFDHEACKEKGD